MKKILKIIGLLVLLVVLAAGGFAAFISMRGIPKYDAPPKYDLKFEYTQARVDKGEKIFSMLCKACHLNKKTCRVSGEQMMDAPKEFGIIRSRNITQDKEAGIGGWTDGELFTLFRTGLRPDGQYIPIYMPKLAKWSDEDIYSVIAFLRSPAEVVQATKEEPAPTEPTFLTKFLCFVAFKPMAFRKDVPQPDTTNPVKWGNYLISMYDCYACHSSDFTKLNMEEPEKSFNFFAGGNKPLNLEGQPMPTPNLTPDKETGIGEWSEDQFLTAVLWGKRPDGTALRYPMQPYARLDTAEVRAIYAYLRTVPPIKNKVQRAP